MSDEEAEEVKASIDEAWKKKDAVTKKPVSLSKD